MSNVILKKNEAAIASQKSDCTDELEQMQGWIAWFNGLHYTQPITDLDKAKEFLSGTLNYHEAAVITFLKAKTPELPPNLQPLRQSWNISECDEMDFSKGNPRFASLEMVEGQLQYAPSVYAAIEADHTVIATPEQLQALQELDRTWSNLNKIAEILHPVPGISRDIFKGEFKSLLGDLIHRLPYGKPDGTTTMWKVEKIDLLAINGFGKKVTK